ncbi:MAG: leucyl aminopeptidase family protein, partial [Thermoleophilia bacterium]|nr:leucyl aminopeptidase family protein [Thermoleophilia bacterium]
MGLSFARDEDGAPRTLHLVGEAETEEFLSTLGERERTWLGQTGFTGALGQLALLPGPEGAVAGAVFGTGTAAQRGRGRFHVAQAAAELPAGAWRLAGRLDRDAAEEAALGWLLSRYRYDRYRPAPARRAMLVPPEGIDARRISILADSEALTRDLVNTPASDMGPAELEAAFLALAGDFGARAEVCRGGELVERNLPMIHAVGRASDRAPRLLDMRWGRRGPRLTLVGKGVCFD